MNTKEKIAIMQAWLDGEPIQFAQHNTRVWYNLTTTNPQWNFDDYQYRIKPKQKVKKTVKYLCFEHAVGFLSFAKEGSNACFRFMEDVNCVRIHEFDMTREIEVEE